MLALVLHTVDAVPLHARARSDPYAIEPSVDAIEPSAPPSDQPPYIKKSEDLVTFDGAQGTTFKWNVINDPVMGGQSSSTFSILGGTYTYRLARRVAPCIAACEHKPIELTESNEAGKVGRAVQKSAVFSGTVAMVPKLDAAGSCHIETELFNGLRAARFNDASQYTDLLLFVRSNTPDFPGFKVSFAANTFDSQVRSFKANFRVPTPLPSDPYFTDNDGWQTIAIPWSEFENDDCNSTDPGGRTHRCCKDHPGRFQELQIPCKNAARAAGRKNALP